MEKFVYASSVDQTTPLYVNIAFQADGRPKPLLVVMHGYNGNRASVNLDIKELAEKNVVALAPDMRGSGDSAGKWDSGGLDTHDILDAVLAAVARYPREINARNLNIVGYSGGGGNAIACAVRFPDLFQTCVSFFGISDYGAWYKSRGRIDCNERMEQALGGPPDKALDMYVARNANAAAGNVMAKLHFFWDEHETQCPPAMIEEFIANYKQAGLDRVAVHISKRADKDRWTHSNRVSNRNLSHADVLFLPDVLAGTISPSLPKKGKLVVNGYLVTRHFAVFIESGQQGRVVIEYDVSDAKPAIKVIENPRQYKVRIEKSPLTTLP
ncbi:MAG: alpha/beta hydrolase [Planctomycetota bacterium]